VFRFESFHDAVIWKYCQGRANFRSIKARSCASRPDAPRNLFVHQHSNKADDSWAVKASWKVARHRCQSDEEIATRLTWHWLLLCQLCFPQSSFAKMM